MDYSELFSSNLIKIHAEFTSQQKMFEVISSELFDSGFVKETFKDAIIAREKNYPTGLYTDKTVVAIPHTDVIHVNKPFIYVVKLAQPLNFIQMGTTDYQIQVKSVFVLGIKEPSEQIGLLSLIMEKLQDDDFINTFKAISSPNEMETFLKHTFRSDQ